VIAVADHFPQPRTLQSVVVMARCQIYLTAGLGMQHAAATGAESMPDAKLMPNNDQIALRRQHRCIAPGPGPGRRAVARPVCGNSEADLPATSRSPRTTGIRLATARFCASCLWLDLMVNSLCFQRGPAPLPTSDYNRRVVSIA